MLLSLTLYISTVATAQLKYAAVRKDNVYYIIDTANKILVDSIQPPVWNEKRGLKYDEGIFKFSRGGKFGYKNIGNNIIVPCIYDEVSDFINGAGIVRVNNRYGAVDGHGKLIADTIYRRISEADKENILVLLDSNEYVAAISTNGKMLFHGKHHSVNDKLEFCEGLLAIMAIDSTLGPANTTAKIGFIDKHGELVIRAVFENSGMHRSRSADIANMDRTNMCGTGQLQAYQYASEHPYYIENDYYRFEAGRALVRANGENVVIDIKGDTVFSIPANLRKISNTGGMFRVYDDRFDRMRRYMTDISISADQHRYSYGYYDRYGKLVFVSLQYQGYNMVNGLLPVMVKSYIKGDYKYEEYKMMKADGTYAFNSRSYGCVYDYHDGYTMVCMPKKHDNYARVILDTAGNYISSDSVSLTAHWGGANGWFLVTSKTNNGIYGFMDKEGKIRIPVEYNWLNPYSQGYSAFRKRVGYQEKWGYIDEKNNIIVTAEYSDALSFQLLKIKE